MIHALAPDAELLLANWEPEHARSVSRRRPLGAAARGADHFLLGHHADLERWRGARPNPRGAGAPPRHRRRARRRPIFRQPPATRPSATGAGHFDDGGDGYHVWKHVNGITQTHNAIKPWGCERVSVELCCPLRAGYEVIVSDATTQRQLGRMRSKETDGGGNAVVAFVPESGHDYRVRVRRLRVAPGGVPSRRARRRLAPRHLSRKHSLSGRWSRGRRCGRGGPVGPATQLQLVRSEKPRYEAGLRGAGAVPQRLASEALRRHLRRRAPRGRPGRLGVVAPCRLERPPRPARPSRTAARSCSNGSPVWATGNGVIHLPAVSMATAESLAITR